MLKVGDRVRHLYLETLGKGEVIALLDKHFNVLVRWSRKEDGEHVEWSFTEAYLVPLNKKGT